MVEKFYAFEALFDKANCVEIAKWFTPVADNRCAAIWRGGDNPTSVSLFDKGFVDHGTGDKGGCLELLGKLMGLDAGNRSDLQRIQQELGDKLGLEPTMKLGREGKTTRSDRLKADGYTLAKTYTYTDEQGVPKHIVERWEHPTLKNEKGGQRKEFVQKTAEGRTTLKGIKTYLYRLKEWIDKEYVVLVEGEKCADSVWDNLHYFATTNASGAGRWEDYYNDWLKGKKIIICADNDDPGRKRTNFLLWALKDICPSIKLITFNNDAEGFDIADFIARDGIEAAKQLIKDTPAVAKDKILRPTEDYQGIMAAKEKNKHNFANYFAFQEKDEHGKPKEVKKPRHINELIKECHLRFLNFPMRVGDRMFDHDRETGEIVYMSKTAQLFSWMMRKSGRAVEWPQGNGYVTKEEFVAGVTASAKKFEAVLRTPDYPMREDVYYAHPPIPAADPCYKYFNTLVEFFNPATESDRILIKTFIAAPLFYIPGIKRPAWIIDSDDGRGTGKTTLVEQIALLYNVEPIKTTAIELKQRMAEVTKRVVSASGRESRIMLIDNVTGNFASAEFSEMITARGISGKAPYGTGEETRPNNLTYVLTANSAIVDDDIATRSFYISLKRSQYSSLWQTKINKYIEDNRYQIIADIISNLEHNEPFDVEPSTRFPEFEMRILMAMCGDMDAYSSVIKTINLARQVSNVDDEHAAMVKDAIKSAIAHASEGHDIVINPEDDAVFIRSRAVSAIMMHNKIDLKMHDIRNLAKNDKLPEVHRKITIWPHNGEDRRTGILWIPKIEKYDPKKVAILSVSDNYEIHFLKSKLLSKF